MNITKMSTTQLEKAIAGGKFDYDAATKTAAENVLASRKAKKANPDGPKADKEPTTFGTSFAIADAAAKKEEPSPAAALAATLSSIAKEQAHEELAKEKKDKKKVVTKKEEKTPAAKKGRKKKDISEYTEAEIYPKGTISGLVRRMIKPKDGSKMAGCTFGEASAAVEKKFERALHPSEFDRSFKYMVKLNIVETKRPRKIAEETK